MSNGVLGITYCDNFMLYLSAPRTCNDLKLLGITISGDYYINPDGPFSGFPPIKVFCDVKTGTFVNFLIDNRVLIGQLKHYHYAFFFIGTTKVDHDLVGEKSVSKCHESGCSVHRVRYKISMSQIAALTSLSNHCEQHIRVSDLFSINSQIFCSDLEHFTFE